MIVQVGWYKKMNKIKGMFVFIIIISFFINMVNGWTEILPDEQSQIIQGHTYFSRSFYSNYSRRFYVIYGRYDFGETDVMISYQHSIDGISWSEPELLRGWGSYMTVKNFAMYLEPNGKYLHYTFIRIAYETLYYRKVEILSNGTINLNITALEQVPISGDYGQGTKRVSDDPSICTNKTGFPMISFEYETGSGSKGVHVIKSTMNNGTWKTEIFEDIWSMESEWVDNGGPNVGNTEQGGKLFPMDEGIGIIWWYMDGAREFHRSMYYDFSADDWLGLSGTLIQDNEGGEWADYLWSIGWNIQENTTVFVKQDESFHTPERIAISAIFLNHTTKTWENKTTISFFELGDAGSMKFLPLVCAGVNGTYNFVWGIDANSSIWYNRMYSNYTLEGWQLWNIFDFDIVRYYIASGPSAYSPMSVIVEEEIAIMGFVNHDYLAFLGDDWEFDYNHYNTTFNDDNGWMFKGEVYSIESYVKGPSVFYLNFTDGRNNIRFMFINSTKEMYVDVETTIGRDESVIGLVRSEWEEFDDSIFRLQWVFIPNINIIDSLGVGLDYYLYHEPLNATTIGDTSISFNIYNLGGFVSYDFDGDGGRITGGDALEIHHTNSTGNGAYVDVIWRRLQHTHLLFSMNVEDNDCFDIHENTGKIMMGIKFLDVNGTWIDGWYFELSIVNGAVDAGGGGLGKAWIVPYVAWYSMDENGSVTNRKIDILSGYPECGDDVGSAVTYTKFYVDLWFNKMNYSTTVGGRVSTYYYGMDEGGWLLWSNWNPITFNQSESMFFDDLRNDEGDIIHSRDIELMKFWIRVLKSGSGVGEDCDTHTWLVMNPEISYSFAGDRMESLNTPDGVKTLVVDMPSGGWLQPLAKAIEGISTAIWKGAIGFIRLLIGGFDSFLIYLGSPISMSQMIEWIMMQASQIAIWMVYVIGMVSSMLTVLSNMLTFITQIVGYAVSAIIWIFVYVVGFPLICIRFFVAILNGETFTIGVFSFDFTSSYEIIQAGLTIAPLGVGLMFMFWLVYGNTQGSGDEDVSGIPRRIISMFGWAKEAFINIFWIYNHIKNEIISLYNFIRSHIPGLGGGGGETEE